MLTRCAVPGHSRRRVRPVLLDPLHLHDTTGPLATRGQGRGSPGGHDQVRVSHVSRVTCHVSSLQRTRPGGREKIRDLLPVGRLHAVLSGEQSS